jgi:hypothetical protein
MKSEALVLEVKRPGLKALRLSTLSDGVKLAEAVA